MAYQNVGTPRFFIDNYSYLKAIGLDPKEYYEGKLPEDWSEEEMNQGFKSFSNYKTVLETPNMYTMNPKIAKNPNLLAINSVFLHIPCGNLISKLDFTNSQRRDIMGPSIVRVRLVI